MNYTNFTYLILLSRYLSKEGESRCDHLHKQLQLANQRRNLLIEELEQNQASVEESYEQRLRFA